MAGDQKHTSMRSASCIFRGVEYVVSTWLVDRDCITIEVEDKLSADQWRGSFDATYIEDLTRKTGNFKQFDIFISMLDSALAQASESVTLDLLTYADLETLRNRKGGSAAANRTVPGPQKAALNTKRYLIVTYTVEFDRIHYPLPLPYMGKPDPVALQDIIRDLRLEIKRLKSQVKSDFRSSELQKLQREYDILLAEKQEVEDAFLRYRREVKNTTTGSAAKEVRILKGVVRNLEEELMHEKSRNQRASSKRNQEYKALMEELEELRASERNLKARVKSLMNELNVLKRGNLSRRTSRSPVYPKPQKSNLSSASRRPLSVLNRSSERSRVGGSGYGRRNSRERSQSREGRRPSTGRSRTPSPGGLMMPRFDPTGFIEEKKRRQQEAKLRMNRSRERSVSGGRRPPRLSGSQERGHSRSRPSPNTFGYRRTHSRGSSVGSVGSRRSSSGLSDVEVLSDASEGRRRRIREVIKPGKTSSSTAWNSPNVPLRKKGVPSKAQRLMSTPDPNLDPGRAAKLAPKGRIRRRDLKEYGVHDQSGDVYNRSSGIADIDARLSALQQFMKENIG